MTSARITYCVTLSLGMSLSAPFIYNVINGTSDYMRFSLSAIVLLTLCLMCIYGLIAQGEGKPSFRAKLSTLGVFGAALLFEKLSMSQKAAFEYSSGITESFLQKISTPSPILEYFIFEQKCADLLNWLVVVMFIHSSFHIVKSIYETVR